VRGDGRVPRTRRQRRGGSPPRARGRLLPGWPEDRPGGITPACAGTAGGIGELRLRGRLAGDGRVQQRVGITPACAGTALPRTPSPPCPGDHPRVRGDGDDSGNRLDRPTGSPPRARGRRSSTHGHLQQIGITPACAGTAGSPSWWGWCRGDHPRVRGDGASWPRRWPARGGSPPRARGRHPQGRRDHRKPGITPACAGTALSSPRPAPWGRDHPRVRGDGIGAYAEVGVWAGSPPRARGRLDGFVRVLTVEGITPACAGTARR